MLRAGSASALVFWPDALSSTLRKGIGFIGCRAVLINGVGGQAVRWSHGVENQEMHGCTRKFSRYRAGFASIVFGLWYLPSAIACSLELIDLGFSVDHRGSIPIAVATYRAIESGQIAPLPEERTAKRAALERVRQKAIAHTYMMTYRYQRMDATRYGGVPLTVLLTQSGAWMRFNPSGAVATYHTEPAQAGEAVLLLPDTVYAALLSGEMALQTAIALGLVRVYDTEQRDNVITSFSDLFAHLSASVSVSMPASMDVNNQPSG
ncbi:hypothetical protein [Photobacterium sp. 1_MG-2023]|uniref:hypothetical protein n=1 Tax=Photobacterium sp. 1_MG-2023 TaxID=3062646 RepID=UPI0026E38C29|nr:hypothetical protein [Photobacterium sp. 1_MG-2023]MDO6708071.1 hypothetical protein [Photobacterium sp. 1_MG-2023]